MKRGALVRPRRWTPTAHQERGPQAMAEAGVAVFAMELFAAHPPARR